MANWRLHAASCDNALSDMALHYFSPTVGHIFNIHVLDNGFTLSLLLFRVFLLSDLCCFSSQFSCVLFLLFWIISKKRKTFSGGENLLKSYLRLKGLLQILMITAICYFWNGLPLNACVYVRAHWHSLAVEIKGWTSPFQKTICLYLATYNVRLFKETFCVCR